MVIFVKLLLPLARSYLREFVNVLLRVCMKYFKILSTLLNSLGKNIKQTLHQPAIAAIIDIHRFIFICYTTIDDS